MDPIKINHVQNNRITHIYIFKGIRPIETLDKLGPDGEGIFSVQEWDTIRRESIPLTLVEAYLHSDDTLDTVKKKIIKHLHLELSTKELYLFGLQKQLLNPAIIYNQLTQIDTLHLTQTRLCQYLLNIVPNGCQGLDTETNCERFLSVQKDVYEFDDFMALQEINWEQPITYTIPIGHKMTGNKKRYPFTANPYNCIVMDDIIKKQAVGIITTLNSNLLFESGKLCHNNIFLCLAQEVLTYAQTIQTLTETNFISVYYPNLISKDDIHNAEELEAKRQALYEEEKPKMGQAFEKYNERVDLFYNMYFSQHSDLDYINNTPGVTNLEFIIHPKYTIHFPLEILFKLIHSDEHIPMIKYNPGISRENIYRLFTNGLVATNGKKIPYLYTINNHKKGKIIQLSRVMARKKRVAFYIEIVYDSIHYEVHCAFEANGNIHVNIELNHPTILSILEEVITAAINEPILQKIKSYLEQSGYNYILFQGLRENNIEIKKITYISSLLIRKNIHLEHYLGCLSSIFNVLEGELTANKNAIIMKYKRVSNYNDMDSAETLINNMQQLGHAPAEIMKQLMQNLQLEEGEAQAKYANWIRLVRTERDLFENKTFTIRTNTGFPITIQRNQSNLHTTVTVESINSIYYLKPLHIYIDSMLRLITASKSSSVSPHSIKSLCRGKIAALVEGETDLRAKVEKGFVEQKSASVENNMIEFGQDDDAFLDMFGLNEDDDGSEEEGDIVFGDIITSQDSNAPSPTGEIDIAIAVSKSPKSIPPSTTPQSTSPQSISSVEGSSPQSDVTSEAEIDLRGILLKGNSNLFIKRKLELQPKLFLKKGKGRFKAYSKACPTQYAKQPVILTNKEKTYIDTQDEAFGTKSYDEFLTYGTNDTKYHYICPRFWCLYDKNGKQRSLTLEEVNAGACGGWDAIIPQGAARIPDGKRIYQFTDTRFHKENVKTNNPLVYKPMWPGFMDPSKHPDNLCIPCCFTRPTHPPAPWVQIMQKNKVKYKNKTTDEIRAKLPPIALTNMYKPEGDGGTAEGGIGPTFARDSKGNIQLDSIQGVKQIREPTARKRQETYNACNQGARKLTQPSKKTLHTLRPEAPLLEAWPLKTGQLGYLPIAVQKFLGYNCRILCQQSNTDRQLKKNTPCLLHKGMERSEIQSFIACIADIYDTASGVAMPDSSTLSNKSRKTIQDMKHIIIQHLTIDNFITYQNGNLIKLFSAPEKGSIDNARIQPYKKSTLYQHLQPLHEESTVYLVQVITAFEAFLAYLRDDTIEIDYEYLWDIVCMPTIDQGGGLFPHGLHLIILHSPNDDITNKIELICPTNHYSSQNYNIHRPILILYSRNGYFEPIYSYTFLEKNKYKIQKLFHLATIDEIMPGLNTIIRHIFEDLQKKCRPLPSMPDIYNRDQGFQSNIEFYKIKHELDKGQLPFVFSTQLVNFETKVIGCLAVNPSDDKDFIYIPSLPSALDPTLEYAFVGDPTYWISFQDSVQKLHTLYTNSQHRIPCNPVIKIVSDGVLVGLLTMTNQFVPCIPEPFQESLGEEHDGLRALFMNSEEKDLNILNNDQQQLTDTRIDTERLLKIKQIHLESHFYNVFRNLLRILLTYYENKTYKNELLTQIRSIVTNYPQKLTNIQQQLTQLMNKYVDFVEYKTDTLQHIEDIRQCLNLPAAMCGEKSYCAFSSTTEGICKFQLPKTNLINGADNEIHYFGKLADELIRYARIRTFIFHPQKFLSFQEIGYKLRDNEIILLEAILYGNYFDGLVAVKDNPYLVNKHTYDTAPPSISVPYVETFDWEQSVQNEPARPCILEKSKQTLKMGYWETHGLSHYQITEFQSSFNCSWELLREIIHLERMNKQPITLSILQNQLVTLYHQLFTAGKEKELRKIMKHEGKADQADSIGKGTKLLDILIPSNYYLTTLDFCILAHHYQLPLILLCRTNIRGLRSKTLSFIKGKTEKCYIILMGGLAPTANSNRSPHYGLIVRDLSPQLSTTLLDATFTHITNLSAVTTEDFITLTKQTIKLKVKKPTKKAKVQSSKIRIHKQKSKITLR